MHVGVVVAAIRQAVDQPRVAVEVEDHRFVEREQAVEILVAQTVRVLAGRGQLVEINDVDETHFQVGEVLPQQHGRGQRFLGRNVAGAGHHHIRFLAGVVAGPLPDADALGAVFDRRIHVQILQVLLLVADDDVDVIGAVQAVRGGGQQGVDVGRQIDAGDFRALVHHHIQETRILMRKAVVVLAPDGRGDQQVER